MRIANPVVTASVAALLCGTAASAQSLGDVARQEQARRKTVKFAGKVYTNDSLRPAPQPSSDTSAAPAATEPAPAPDTQTGNQAKPDDKAPADDQKKDEAYWKDRLSQARTALDRSKTFAEALQSRINALTADFSARSDPAQRSVIERDRQKATAELDRVNQEIKDNTKAIADIQEEARKAGVPAGWYR